MLSLAGCGPSPVGTPVTWWHDLEGGVIAERRPPPPGADLPYPKIYTVPKRPMLPDPAYRQAVEAALIAERDRTRQIAARNPIVVPATPKPPPPPAHPPPAGASGSEATANATLPAAETAPPSPAGAVAPPDAESVRGTVLLAGAPLNASGLPALAEAPPPPASFEGVPAEPLPTPPPPIRPLPGPAGTRVLFAPGVAQMAASQNEALHDVVARRGKKTILVIGHGDEQSDTPEGQAAALTLGLARAKSVAAALAAMHVPASAIRVGAASVGVGATVQYE